MNIVWDIEAHEKSLRRQDARNALIALGQRLNYEKKPVKYIELTASEYSFFKETGYIGRATPDDGSAEVLCVLVPDASGNHEHRHLPFQVTAEDRP